MMNWFGANAVGIICVIVGVLAEFARNHPVGQKFFEDKFGSNWMKNDNAAFLGRPMIIAGALLCFPAHDYWDVVMLGIMFFAFKSYVLKTRMTSAKEKDDTNVAGNSVKQSGSEAGENFPEVDEEDANPGSVVGAAVVAGAIFDSDDDVAEGEDLLSDGADLSDVEKAEEVLGISTVEAEESQEDADTDDNDVSAETTVETEVKNDGEVSSGVDTSTEEASEDNSDSDSED